MAPKKANNGNHCMLTVRELFSSENNVKNNTTANDAPAVTPIKSGDARGFFVIPCKIASETASAIPTKRAIIMRGNLKSTKIVRSNSSP